MSHIIPVDYANAAQMVAAVLRAGDLIVLPTDTVYGVGCALDAVALSRIFEAKQRPPERAVPVLLADADSVLLVARAFPDPARRLAEAFWPGPLTLVLPKRDGLPSNLSYMPTIGVRVPDHAGARAIIAAGGGALAVTSANRSDEPPALSVQEAMDYLADAVALYLDGGPSPGGVASTVVAFEGDELQMLRAGPISEADLRAALG
ncbi:MAG: threonylcarbamoyl-AMP synthase [Anaerolineae bacterium]|nr:threonylcarbamoyl-AMP synthase [Anaerolineae bacterium]